MRANKYGGETWQRTMEDPRIYAHETNNLGLIEDPKEKVSSLTKNQAVLWFFLLAGLTIACPMIFYVLATV